MCCNEQLKVLWPETPVKDVLRLAIDPPSASSIDRTVAALIDLGVLAPDNTLTPLGSHSCLTAFVCVLMLYSTGRCLSRFPLEPKIGKMLLYSVLFGCSDYALTAAAYISAGKVGCVFSQHTWELCTDWIVVFFLPGYLRHVRGWT